MILRSDKPQAFQSTPSAWRETSSVPLYGQGKPYFNPLPPHGGRPLLSTTIFPHNLFQSTPSAWRETYSRQNQKRTAAFQSTPSAWRETRNGCATIPLNQISIHSLRMEGDRYSQSSCFGVERFQSTPSAWRETTVLSCWYRLISISIHSLRMEGDG